jgi:hypothetical protein
MRPWMLMAWRLSLTVLLSVFGFATAAPARAAAAAPWWNLRGEAVPSNLQPGQHGQVILVASNLGDRPAKGGQELVRITDKLPVGLAAIGVEKRVVNGVPVECSVGTTITCTYAGSLNPYEQISIPIIVNVQEPPDTVATLSQEATIDGGGGSRVSANVPIKVSEQPTAFGVSDYELSPFNEDGTAAAQAGSHPFQLTTSLTLNENSERQPVALPRDLSFRLPAGFVGNPTAVRQCAMSAFFSLVEETNLCPASSAVGVATVTANEPATLHVFTQTVPVFNLVPSQGEPARLGFEVIGKVPVVIDTSVRTGRDYAVVASVKGATQTAGLLNSQVTLWGVPGDPRHDSARGWECVAGGFFSGQAKRTCPAPGELALPQAPFLTLPTSCPVDVGSEPLRSVVEADSWAEPDSVLASEYAWLSSSGQGLGMEGCGVLPFSPSIEVTPEEDVASTPTGLRVDVEVPQRTTLEPEGLAEADVRDTTVTLPEGVELNPSAANGLQACSEAQVGFVGWVGETNQFTDAPAACPDASKVGLVRISTPLLSHELTGGVYLAEPAPNGEAGKNPFGSLIALYIVAEDPVSGVLVKLAGEGHVDEQSLRVSTTFANTPQVPFENLEMELFGGAKASLSTPAACGGYQTEARFTPWSGTPPVSESTPEGEFEVLAGVGGGGCPVGEPFDPGFIAQSSSVQAGAFTGFSMELSRPDGDQALAGVSVHLPSGVAALLSSVTLCPEPQASQGTCGPESQIGETIESSGLGAHPYIVRGGRVYITGPYGGAPFGLSIVAPAKAGPFDLGNVIVRSGIYIDRNDASVTIVSDPLPTQLKGIPLQLGAVQVLVNRPGFEFNPTSCEPMQIEGTITGSGGAQAQRSSPFKAENCSALPFSPELIASALGHGSKAEGTTFAVTVRSGGTDANGVAQAGIAKVQLQLPKQLSSRLPTLQKACTDAVFNANPASCDEGSKIGYATIHTPVLKNPLSGPAYLVSHGGAAFPDVEFVLQGENIELVLDGKTDIKGEVTYSKFESTPDAPFTVFETVLPAGPHGVLTPNVAERKRFSLCGETLEMPTTMIAQNGTRIEHETKVQVTGCAEVKSAKTHKPTLKQQFKHALRTCQRDHKHAKAKRVRCEQHARTHYTRLALAACRHKHKHAKRKRRSCERGAHHRYAAKTAHRARKTGKTRG